MNYDKVWILLHMNTQINQCHANDDQLKPHESASYCKQHPANINLRCIIRATNFTTNNIHEKITRF